MDEDDEPQLSEATLAALREWVQEQQMEENDRPGKGMDGAVEIVAEDWRLSQFWYDSATAGTVAAEIHHLSNTFDSPRIACIACPSLFVELKNKYPGVDVHLFEYDRRFEKYGTEFSFYDYNRPEDVEEMHGTFHIVVADPPYLSEGCLEKTAKTMKAVAADPKKSFLLLLTGAVQREHVVRLLDAQPCRFRPTHHNKLGNEFMLFLNYDPGTRLGGLDARDAAHE